MYHKAISMEKTDAKAKRLLDELAKANQDPAFVKAAKRFYRFHTGKTLRI